MNRRPYAPGPSMLRHSMLVIGASFFYKPHDGVPYQAQEVRAFGLFLQDLVTRMHTSQKGMRTTLEKLASQCIHMAAVRRPTFLDIHTSLLVLLRYARVGGADVRPCAGNSTLKMEVCYTVGRAAWMVYRRVLPRQKTTNLFASDQDHSQFPHSQEIFAMQ